MSDYFIVLDAAFFNGQFRSAMSASRRLRSFEPCRELCAALQPAARAYAERYHLGDMEPLLTCVLAGMAFDRTIWRALVGEMMLFAAVEIPEFQTGEYGLKYALAPDSAQQLDTLRESLPPILQALDGSRDLIFGATVYRPDHCGFNNSEDVPRLAAYLQSLDPATWTIDRFPEADQKPEEAMHELDFAREWFPDLLGLFVRAQAKKCVIVHERMY